MGVPLSSDIMLAARTQAERPECDSIARLQMRLERMGYGCREAQGAATLVVTGRQMTESPVEEVLS